MTALFALEWMGGPAEHHFRRARPDVEALAWGTLDPSDFAPSAVAVARRSWTDVAINELRAVAAFAEIVRLLVEARAPLDLVGMASGFLTDETAHVELASRLAMALGGAAPRTVDTARFALRAPEGLTQLQRANEVVLRVCCVSEAFAGITSLPRYRATTHPLVRDVYRIILADEALHHRLGSLYFEWAAPLLDDTERARLAAVAADALARFRPFYEPAASRAPAARSAPPPAADLHALGWSPPEIDRAHARAAVERTIVAQLAAIGIDVAAP